MLAPATFLDSHLSTRSEFENARKTLSSEELYEVERKALENKVKHDIAANGPGLRALQMELIQWTWKEVETLPVETVGVLLFKHIFEAAPQAASLFSFGKVAGFNPAADHSKNPAVTKHAVGVVKTVGTAIGLLQDLSTLVPVLKDLGKRHTKYGVVAAHYPIVGGAFMKTLQVGMGAAFTPEVEASYAAMWNVVQSVMLSEV